MSYTELSPFLLFAPFHGELHLHGIVYNQIHKFIEALEKLALLTRTTTARAAHTRILPSIRTAVCS
jgi:hypothetical protein